MRKTLLATALLFAINICLAQNISRFELEQNFMLNNDTLYGTLLSKGKKVSKINKLPVVLIIPGSGPTDRNGNSKAMQGENNSFQQLADSLLQYDIASFRYDKPGVGKSQFSGSEADMRFENNTLAALSAIQKLQEIGFKNIIVAGHSQGSLIGMLAAQQADVKAFISIEGSAQNAYTLIKEQLSKQLPEPMQKSTFNKLDSIKNGYPVTQYNPMLASLLRESIQPYLREYFSYTPTDEIAKLDIPILVIQGGRDIQTTVKEGEALKAAAPASTYLFYQDMNHVLKQVDESDAQNYAAYTDPDFPLAKNLATDLANWINNL